MLVDLTFNPTKLFQLQHQYIKLCLLPVDRSAIKNRDDKSLYNRSVLSYTIIKM